MPQGETGTGGEQKEIDEHNMIPAVIIHGATAAITTEIRMCIPYQELVTELAECIAGAFTQIDELTGELAAERVKHREECQKAKERQGKKSTPSRESMWPS